METVVVGVFGRKVCGGMDGRNSASREKGSQLWTLHGGGSLEWWNQMRRQERYRGTARLVDARASVKYIYLHIRSANLECQA